MRLSLFSVLMFLQLNANAQSLDRLDANNGFRIFKFGMSPNQFHNLSLKPSNSSPRDVKYYSYIGNDINGFNGAVITAINLGFYKNQLFGIQIEFGTVYKEYTTGEYGEVQQGLEANFGSDYHHCDDQSANETNCTIWDGNRIRLESIRFNLSEKDGSRKKDFNYIQGYILFTDKVLSLRQKQSEIE